MPPQTLIALTPRAPQNAYARRATVSIGVLADRYGVCPESLRNWEREGLIPPARRTAGGHRRFGAEHVEAIEDILGGPVRPGPALFAE